MRRIIATGFLILVASLALAQEGGVTGVVVNGNGRPIANAEVHYVDEITGSEQATRTSGNGNFALAPGLRGVVTVTARNLVTLRRAWPPRDGGGRLRFELVPPAIVSGTLLDAATRQPIEGTVTVHVDNPINAVSGSAVVRGSFRFTDLPPGRAAVYAYAEGYAPRFGVLNVEAGKAYETRLDMLLEAVAGGRVVDAAGEPVVGARVRVGYDVSVEGADILAGMVRGFVTTDANGVFVIGGLIPDTPIAFRAEVDGRVSNVISVTAIEPGFQRNGLAMRIR